LRSDDERPAWGAAAEAVARTSAIDSAIFELVNMVCFRCAVTKEFPPSFMKTNMAKSLAKFQ
jgi:hypothetical protein